MSETLTSQQLLHNSYHLAICSSLLAIQSTLSLQQTMLRSDDSTFADIKSAIASQNANLLRFTKTIAETFSKISSYKPLQPRSATSAATAAGFPSKIAPATTTTVGISPSLPQSRSATPEQIQAAPLQTSLSYVPPRPLLPSNRPPPEKSYPIMSQQEYFYPAPTNNHPLQPEQSKLQIGDSDLNDQQPSEISFQMLLESDQSNSIDELPPTNITDLSDLLPLELTENLPDSAVNFKLTELSSNSNPKSIDVSVVAALLDIDISNGGDGSFSDLNSSFSSDIFNQLKQSFHPNFTSPPPRSFLEKLTSDLARSNLVTYGSTTRSSNACDLDTKIVDFSLNKSQHFDFGCKRGWPMFSHDETIFFHRRYEDEWWNVYHVDLMEKEVVGARIMMLASSQDGKRIAVTRTTKNRLVLVVFNHSFHLMALHHSLDPAKSSLSIKMLSENNFFIFDPGGKMKLEFLFVARFIHSDIQLHNSDITTSTPKPPTCDLEDKVDFEGMVMIGLLMHKDIIVVSQNNVANISTSQAQA